MKYLGIARVEQGRVIMPDAYEGGEEGGLYEVVEVGGDILLMPPPLDRERLARIEQLAKQSIQEHRQALEGLAG